MGRGGARVGAGRKPKADARKVATFTLPPDQLAAIEAIAGRDGISKSEALSRLIARGLAADIAPTMPTIDVKDAAPAQTRPEASKSATDWAGRPIVVPAVGDVIRDKTRRQRVRVDRLDNFTAYGLILGRDGKPRIYKDGKTRLYTYTFTLLALMAEDGNVAIEKAMI